MGKNFFKNEAVKAAVYAGLFVGGIGALVGYNAGYNVNESTLLSKANEFGKQNKIVEERKLKSDTLILDYNKKLASLDSIKNNITGNRDSLVSKFSRKYPDLIETGMLDIESSKGYKSFTTKISAVQKQIDKYKADNRTITEPHDLITSQYNEMSTIRDSVASLIGFKYDPKPLLDANARIYSLQNDSTEFASKIKKYKGENDSLWIKIFAYEDSLKNLKKAYENKLAKKSYSKPNGQKVIIKNTYKVSNKTGFQVGDKVNDKYLSE